MELLDAVDRLRANMKVVPLDAQSEIDPSLIPLIVNTNDKCIYFQLSGKRRS